MANPTFNAQGRGGFVTGYVINLAANTPVALPTEATPGTGGPSTTWKTIYYINQSQGSTPPNITLGDANVVANGGIIIPPGQTFQDQVARGPAFYASATGTAQLLVLVLS